MDGGRGSAGGRRYHGKSHDEMMLVLNTLAGMAGQMNFGDAEQNEAFSIAMRCVATVANRMLDGEVITWDPPTMA